MNEALHDNIDYKSFPSFDRSPKGAGDAFVHVFLNSGPKPTVSPTHTYHGLTD